MKQLESVNPWNRVLSIGSILLIVAFLLLLTGCTSTSRTFITASGDQLVEGKRPVRFVSFNIPNLHYVEDNHTFTGSLPFRLPNEFEIRDALTAIDQMGGGVVRIYTLWVSKADDPPGMPRHVLAPGEFNEEAFRTLDQVVAVAEELDVRLIIPFVDNWWWWGGIAEYAAFRGKEKEAFWTDPEIVADFKETINYVINRTNTITGKVYRDDPTILAWETGNELESPFEWAADIAAYIKSLDANHLVIDGFHASVARQEAIDDPNIDLITTHHYTPADQMVSDINETLSRTRGKKPYFVGEFGFIPTEGIEDVLDAVVDGGAAGALIWSLRFRNRDGGFYWHHENASYRSYHWPGFDSGSHWDENGVLALMREKAAEIRRTRPPRLPKPAAPVLLPIGHPSEISWQGVAGAQWYAIERSESEEGPWKLLHGQLSDAHIAYKPLYQDTSAVIGKTYHYRLFAVNESGQSPASAIAGPVTVTSNRLIDEYVSLDIAAKATGTLALVDDQLQLYRYDITRVAGKPGDTLTYAVPGIIREVNVYSYLPETREGLDIELSVDGTQFVRPILSARDYAAGESPHHPVLLSTNGVAGNTSFVRLTWTGEVQVGRLEIEYSQRR